MKKSKLMDDMLSIHGGEMFTYKFLLNFADNPLLEETLMEKFGKVLYQKCVFALTHINLDVNTSKKEWNNIVDHRKGLNKKLQRDVGLKVAAIDYLENISGKSFNMTTIQFTQFGDIVDIAIRDKLSGLYIRSLFDELFEKAFQMYIRYKEDLTIMMIDIDHFKEFNDTYGHPIGDKAITLTGYILLKTTRKSDIVCRYGGEEFVVLMPHTNITTARQVAERIRQTFEDTDIGDSKLTVSIGICQASDSFKAASQFLKKTDEALYKAKNEGRNRIASAP